MLNKIRKFIAIARFYASRSFIHPSEAFSVLGRRILTLASIIVFWYVITPADAQRGTIGILLIGASAADLSVGVGARLARDIARKIKSGQFDRNLLQPINVLFNNVAEHTGSYYIELLSSVVTMIFGIYLTGIGSMVGLIIFILMIVVNFFVFGPAYNILIAALTFKSIESSALRLSIFQLTLLPIGKVLPFTVLSGATYQLMAHNPLAGLGFIPAKILSTSSIDWTLVISYFVSVSMITYLAGIYWKYQIRYYDAAGS